MKDIPTVKFCLTIVFISLFFFANAQNKMETSISLNGFWSFKIDSNNVGETEGWSKKNYHEIGWDSISVPSNWDTRNEYSHYDGKAWYQKIVVIPPSWKDKKIYLKFDGVYFDSKVWLNGELLGSNNNGFLPFLFNVSDLIDRNGENKVVVCADNTFRLGATWNWGGIRRSVKLMAYDDVHIALQHITPTVDLTKGTAKVAVKVYLENEGEESKRVDGLVEIHGPGIMNKSIAFKTDISAHSKKTINVHLNLDRKEVHLWHFDDPFLYNCITNIKIDGKIVNQINDRFGLRKIEVNNQNYTFKLNGESVRLVGFNLVPDDRTTGNTLPLWRIKADIDDMKSLGCNMARLTHFPLPKEMYDYLDERGILVFPEVPLWGKDKKVDPDNAIPKDWLRRLIENNYNHPCIIGWSVGNEIGYNPLVLKYVEKATELSRSLDSTRLAVMVSHTADRTPDPIDYSDLGLVNKYSANLNPVTQKMHLQHPNKLLFYTEYGIDQTSEDLNTNLNAKALLDSIRFKPYLMGVSLWTYNDYRSHYSNTKGFTENRPWGVVNVFRQRKKSWYAIQKEYAPLRAFKIEDINTGKSNSTAILSLIPRAKLDLPAYAMKNYRVVWLIKDEKGKVLSADYTNLPYINPGDKAMKKSISWPQLQNAAMLQIELVSPLNYVLTDTTVYFLKPKSPTVIYSVGAITQTNGVDQKTASIRVVFEKSLLARDYKIKYGKEKLVSVSPVTVNNFIDIKNLDFNQTYNFELVAINNIGESEPLPPISTSTAYTLAPPLIKYTEPADRGAFIGYETLQDDYQFQVRYSTVRGNYTPSRSIKTTNKGVLFLPNLINGQTYYCQMRRLNQNSYPSPWSEEIEVKPDGGAVSVSPELSGISRKGEHALILFTPVKKAIGYVLNYRISGNKIWSAIEIDAAQINQYELSGLKNGLRYEFRIAAINSFGISNFSDVKQAF
jgi:beta-galactosidase